MYCVFCGTPRDEWITRKDDINWYVCGSCTQRLMTALPEVLVSALRLAIERDLPTKALALKSFMDTEEEVNERESNNRKSNYGKRRVRAVRGNGRKPWQNKKKQQSAVSEDNEDKKNIP